MANLVNLLKYLGLQEVIYNPVWSSTHLSYQKQVLDEELLGKAHKSIYLH